MNHGRRSTAFAVLGIGMLLGGLSTPADAPMWISGSLMVVGSVFLVDAGVPLARRMFPKETCEENGPLVEGGLTVVGTLYAIVLGFVVVVAWESTSAAEENVFEEANALADIERMSRGFPVDVRRQVQDAARAYGELVVHEEWDAMQHTGQSVRADAALTELWIVYSKIEDTEQDSPLYQESVTRLNDLGDARRLRMLAAADEVPRVLWFLVYTGGAITLVLCYQLGTARRWQTHFILGCVAAALAFSIFLLIELEGPFRGHLRIDPDPFVFVLDHMQNLER